MIMRDNALLMVLDRNQGAIGAIVGAKVRGHGLDRRKFPRQIHPQPDFRKASLRRQDDWEREQGAYSHQPQVRRT